MCYYVTSGNRARHMHAQKCNVKSSLFIMWHQSLNKLISLISLLFLFIKSGVGLVYLKLVRKHTQPGNSLQALRVPRPL